MTEPRPFYNVSRGDEIVERLHAIELSHNVRVLYAIESGSRAWGFASPNSDWDVRFIYVHPEDWYLNVHEHRDVIEIPIDGDLDINGWEVRKSLRLLRKGNPVLFEWLKSPILYLEGRDDASGNALMEDYRRVASDLFNPLATVYHYWHMAKGELSGIPSWRGGSAQEILLCSSAGTGLPVGIGWLRTTSDGICCLAGKTGSRRGTAPGDR
jgi:hypothetical protein